jgi:hypothetical protein
MDTLPKAVVVESYLADEYQPAMQVLRLRWDPDSPGIMDRSWYLPQHVTLKGPAPERFGMTVTRSGTDSYMVRLAWNDMYLSWTRLTRVQLLTSALSAILRALGQDLWQLLNKPVQETTDQAA